MSAPLTGGASSVPGRIASSPPTAGAPSLVSVSETDSSFQPKWVRVVRPGLWQGSRWLLTEESFVRIFITEQRPQTEQMAKYGVSYSALTCCRKLYGPSYAAELRALRSKNHSRVMRGNTRGSFGAGVKRPHPIRHLLPRERLEELVRRGLKDVVIARELNTTEHHVRRNIKHFEIQRDFLLPPRLQHLEVEEVAHLERLAPGFKAAAQRFYVAPHEFFQLLYLGMAKLSLLVDDLRSFAPSHRYYVGHGLIPRDHIAWSLNRHELRLSLALLDAKVPHRREICFFKNWRADFCLPGRLMIEVDGAFHTKDAATKRRDRRKLKKAEALGYKVVRFPTRRIDTDLDGVVAEIIALSKSLSAPSTL